MRRWMTVAASTIAIISIATAAAACGGDDDDGDDGDGESTPGGAVTQRLEIGAENSEEFTKDELSASPGEITVVFENNEDGVIHNIAFFEGDSASGDSLAATALEPGPTTQEVTLTVEAGDYFYHCETHTVMDGTLTVE